METKNLRIAPVSELAGRIRKKKAASPWNAAVYRCGEGGIMLASAAHSLAARRGGPCNGIKTADMLEAYHGFFYTRPCKRACGHV